MFNGQVQRGGTGTTLLVLIIIQIVSAHIVGLSSGTIPSIGIYAIGPGLVKSAVFHVKNEGLGTGASVAVCILENMFAAFRIGLSVRQPQIGITGRDAICLVRSFLNCESQYLNGFAIVLVDVRDGVDSTLGIGMTISAPCVRITFGQLCPDSIYMVDGQV